MKKLFSILGYSLIPVLLLLVLTSAIPATRMSNTGEPEANQKKTSVIAFPASKELLKAATELKGKPLTFKEKLAIRLFGKKWTGHKPVPEGSGKSQLIALLLCICFGGIGVHRFYLGYTWQGIVQFLTLGACGIWTLIDLIRIITGDLQPKNGPYSKTL